MRYSMSVKLGYRFKRKKEDGCGQCVYIETYVVDTLKGDKTRKVSYCNLHEGTPCVSKDCVCRSFLKLRSGTETAA
jgi:hypothetical protein